MAISIKHKFQSQKEDGDDEDLVKPSDWNDEHDLTLAQDKLLGRASSGTGDVEEITCTAAGRALLDDADAGEQRTTLGLGSIATQAAEDYYTAAEVDAGFQPLDADLTAIAALSTQAYGRSLLTVADEATFKATVNLEIGTDVQAYSSNLDGWSNEDPDDYYTAAEIDAVALRLIDGTLLLTVGSGGQYASLNQALAHASTIRPEYISGGVDVEIKLLSGYAETETVSVAGLNLGYIRITAEDPVVDASAVTGNLFEVTQRGVLPIITCVFDMDGSGGHGVFCAEGTVTVQGGGIINAGEDNVRSIANGTVALIEGTFTGAGAHAVFLNHNSHAEIYDCDCSGAGTHGLMIRHTSKANCSIVDFRKNAPSATWGENADIRLVSGAIIDVDDVQGGFSQEINQHTPNGIIFFEDDRSGSPGFVLLGYGTVSNAATLDVIFGDYTEFRGFRLMLTGFRPATSDTALRLRLTTNEGSSWLTSNYRYATAVVSSFDGLDEGFAAHFSDSASEIDLVIAASNNSAHSIDGHINILNPFATTFQQKVLSDFVSDQHNFSTFRRFVGGGSHSTSQNIDGMRVYFSSGNIAAGNWALYGYY